MNTPNCGDCFHFRFETEFRDDANQLAYAKCAVADPLHGHAVTQRLVPSNFTSYDLCGIEGRKFEPLLEVTV